MDTVFAVFSGLAFAFLLLYLTFYTLLIYSNIRPDPTEDDWLIVTIHGVLFLVIGFCFYEGSYKLLWWLPSFVEDDARETVSSLVALCGGAISVRCLRFAFQHAEREKQQRVDRFFGRKSE